MIQIGDIITRVDKEKLSPEWINSTVVDVLPSGEITLHRVSDRAQDGFVTRERVDLSWILGYKRISQVETEYDPRTPHPVGNLVITVQCVLPVHDLTHYDARNMREAAINAERWYGDGTAQVTEDILGADSVIVQVSMSADEAWRRLACMHRQ